MTISSFKITTTGSSKMVTTWSKHVTIWNSILRGMIQIGKIQWKIQDLSTKNCSSQNSKRSDRMNTLSFSRKFTSVNFT